MEEISIQEKHRIIDMLSAFDLKTLQT
jgi:hypothetical protein